MTSTRQQDLPELPDTEKKCATWSRHCVTTLSNPTVLSFTILFHNHAIICSIAGGMRLTLPRAQSVSRQGSSLASIHPFSDNHLL